MLVLRDGVLADVLAHARETAPEECCGVLAGDRESDGATVDASTATATTYRRVPNAAADPRSTYEMAPTALLAAIERVESDGDAVVGFAHSHPDGPPEMSDTDRREATWTGYRYLLADVEATPPSVDAWRWTGERFADEAVVVR